MLKSIKKDNHKPTITIILQDLESAVSGQPQSECLPSEIYFCFQLMVWLFEEKKNILRRFKNLRSRKSTIYGTSNVFASTDYGESCVCS